jgi:RHS repeat-associated protein
MTQVTQSGVAGGNALADKRVNFNYNADGQFNTISRYADLAGNDLVASGTYGYNAAGELASLSYTQGSTGLAAYQWQYDAAGNVTQMLSGADAAPGSSWGEVDCQYGNTNQLTGAIYTNFANAPANESYGYDSNGNRTSRGIGSASVVGADNQIFFDGTYTYCYDADGNETARWVASGSGETQPGPGDTDITTYAWDYRNRLTTVTHYASYAAFGGDSPDKTVAYSYDALNRLVTETVTLGDGSWTKTAFVYDGSQVALQFDSSGTSGTPGTLAAADLSHRYLWGPAVDQLLADEQVTTPSQSGTVAWALTDNQGTVRDLAVYNASTGTTTIVDHRVYDAFGNLVSQTNPATGTAAAVDCLFGYTGQMFDQYTGLQYNRLRWYDPRLSRFMSQDPSGFLYGDANLYRYVGNSPANYTDPWGLCENPTPPLTNPSTGDVQYQIGDPSWNAGVPPTPISQIPPPNLVPNPFDPGGPPLEIGGGNGLNNITNQLGLPPITNTPGVPKTYSPPGWGSVGIGENPGLPGYYGPNMGLPGSWGPSIGVGTTGRGVGIGAGVDLGPKQSR